MVTITKKESAKLRALRAHVLTCLTCLHALVPMCLACLHAHVPMCLAWLCAHMPCMLCVTTCSRDITTNKYVFNIKFSLNFCYCSLSFSCEIKMYVLAFLLPSGSHLVFVNTTVYMTKFLFDVKFFSKV